MPFKIEASSSVFIPARVATSQHSTVTINTSSGASLSKTSAIGQYIRKPQTDTIAAPSGKSNRYSIDLNTPNWIVLHHLTPFEL